MNAEDGHIFDKLVLEESGETDFIGRLAYSIYKKNKIDYIKKNNPNNKELIKWRELQCQKGQCDLLRSKAKILINRDDDRKKSEWRDEVSKGIKQDIKDIKDKSKKQTFIYGVWQNLFASFLVALITILVVVLYNKVDIVKSSIDWLSRSK